VEVSFLLLKWIEHLGINQKPVSKSGRLYAEKGAISPAKWLKVQKMGFWPILVFLTEMVGTSWIFFDTVG